jgi:molybdenum cofactor cytidylyltransferase
MDEGTLASALGVAADDVVALVGAGGKTTAMFRLAEEIAAAGGRVVTTTTTRLAAREAAHAPCRVRTVADVPGALATARHVLLAGDVDGAPDKASGVAPEAFCALRLAGTTRVVEADGARGLPFKAPDEHEPVVPACSTLVVTVVGIDAVGRPLAPDQVHRPERIARIHPGPVVTPAMIAAVAAHPEGGCKNLPPGARVVLLINKVDDEGRRQLARQVAERALRTGAFAGVVLAALGRPGGPAPEALRP